MTRILSKRLPAWAQDTLDMIWRGAPKSAYRWDEDGTTFHNYRDQLPKRPEGYYKEYTANQTLEKRDAQTNPARIVVGANGEFYWSPDHYATDFQAIVF